MPISTSWKIEIGDRSGWTDFVSRCAGVAIEQRLTLGMMAATSCTLTFFNNDGALSPDGGGTYSSTDWFSKAVRVRATVTDGTNTTTVQVFAGIVSGFDLADDGVNSTVQISSDDMFTVAGRQVFEGENVQLSESPDDQIFEMFNNVTGFTTNPLVLPTLGSLDGNAATAFVTDASLVPQSTTTVVNYNEGRNLKSVVNNEIMPAGPSVAWPTTIDWFDYDIGPDQQNITFYGFMVDRHLVRIATDEDYSSLGQYDDGRDTDKTGARTFVFDTSPTGTELPLSTSLERAWAIDEVTNNALVRGQFPTTLTRQAASSSSSETKYGRRSVQFLSAANPNDADAATAAQLWANRNDTPRFYPRQLTVTDLHVKAKAADTAWQAWADLLDVQSGLFNMARVNYTPTGIVGEVTADCVIMGRRIEATRAEARVIMDLVPLQDYSAFVLDSSTLGVLDQNRLG